MNITSGVVRKAQKVVLYGVEGIGKSTFASQFPNPLFSDTEGSTAHLDVQRFDKPTSWPMLMAQVDYVKKNRPCSTYVIDTADWAEKLAKEYIISQNPNHKSIEDYGYGKGYTMLAEEWGRFLNRLQELVDAGINVLILAHAMMRKFEQPQELGSYDRWELKLEKKTAPLTKEWADAVLFANYEIFVENVDGQGAVKGKNRATGGRRVMNTSHHPAFDAKNRWGLPEVLEFSFEPIKTHIPDGLLGLIKPSETAPVLEAVPEDEEKAIEIMRSEKASIKHVPDIVEDFSFFPKALQDLIANDQVTTLELQNIIFAAGHYPAYTPLQNLDPAYIEGALIAQWPTIVGKIKDARKLSF